MGMEAITKAYVRTQCRQRDITEEQFAESTGIKKRDLDSWVRRTILFQNDDDCHRQAKKASDGFEHGFLDFGEVRQSATACLAKAVSYLRTAILDLAMEQPGQIDGIREGKYAEPLGAWPLIRVIRGKLIGDVANLAPEGHAYPMIDWKYKLKRFRRDKSGKFRAFPEESLRTSFAPGLSIIDQTYALFGPTGAHLDLSPGDLEKES